MVLWACGLLAGIVGLQLLRELPSGWWVLGGVLAVAPLLIWRPGRIFAITALGFGWAWLHAQAALNSRLDPILEGQDLEVIGVIASIPQRKPRFTRFVFDLDAACAEGLPARLSQVLPTMRQLAAARQRLPERVRLSWYDDVPELRAGQCWRMTVRLKRPRGFMNPGGFDYEKWLYQKGIGATGYVRLKPAAVRLADSPGSRPIDRLRQGLAERILKTLADSANAGVIVALAIGERAEVPPAQWNVLVITGTNHLLAISGLHITLVAGLVYVIALRIACWITSLSSRFTAPRVAASSALLAGAGYAGLAGLALPTQRALIMLAVVMGAQLARRSLRPGHALAAALLTVLAWDPLSVLAPEFWLSFWAVAVILLFISTQGSISMGRVRAWLWHWGGLQGALFVALVPLTVLFFQRVSWISPVANLIAAPLVNVVAVPLVLGGVVCIGWAESLAQVLFLGADGVLNVMWWVLDGLAAQPWATAYYAPAMWSIALMALGAVLLIAPPGWPARWLGLILMLPLFKGSQDGLDPGGFRLTLLDVGQGLATVVETAHHTLVYDTGPWFSADFDAGSTVVLPFLHHQGIGVLDVLMISHSDNDHAGGAPALIEALPIARVLSSFAPEPRSAESCHTGQRWVWDGVAFTILHPPRGWRASENNRSCVLKVSTAQGAVLLTGDIEAPAERQLVAEYGYELASEVLLIPHHGSQTSSSAGLIEAVSPKLAVVSAGYRNRFGQPHEAVLTRYTARGIPVRNTANDGALTLRVDPRSGLTIDEGYRERARRYWSAD